MSTLSEIVVFPAVAPVVTEEAGTRGGSHSGMDLAAKRGDPVLAAFDGEVIFVGGDGASGSLPLGNGEYVTANGEGRTVEVRRKDGLISRVGHLEGYAVRVGDKVKAGHVVGFAGDSGYSTGVHIHWELRWDRVWSGGNWINPRTVSPKAYTINNGTTMPSIGNGSEMFMIAFKSAGKETLFAVVGPMFFLEFTGQAAANNLNRQLTGSDKCPALVVSKQFWDTCKKAAQTGSNK